MEILGAPRRWTQTNPETTDQERETDVLVRESLRPLLAMTAAVQGCAALYYGPSISGLGTIVLALSAAMTGMLCVLVWKQWPRWSTLPAQYVVGGVFTALLMHCLLRVAYEPSYGQPSGLALIIVACGATLLWTRWLVIAAAASVITWSAVAIPTLPALDWVPGLFLLLAASGASLLLLKVRLVRHTQTSKDEAKASRWLRRLQAGLDASSVPIALLDTDGRVRACNEAWRRAPALFPGAGDAGALGVDFFQACRQAAGAGDPEAAQLGRGVRQVAQGRRDSYSQICSAGDGKVDARASRSEITPGGFGLTLSLVPVEERQETPVDDQRPVVDLLLRLSPEGRWEWDLDLGEMRLSRDWREMLGYSEEELTSDPDEWLERIHRRDLQSFMAALSDHLDGKTELFEAEHRVLGSTGEYHRMTARGLAVHDEKGRAVRLVGTVARYQGAAEAESAAASVAEGLSELSASSRAG